MESRAVIPTPPGQKWREFRVRFLPLVVFTATLAAIVVVWREYVAPPSLVAQVEPITADVRTRDTGILTNVLVSRFQFVHRGDVVAEVIATDTRGAGADLQLLRTEMAVSQLELSTIVDRERLAFSYQDLQTTFLQMRTDLETAKAELPHAEYNAVLASNLFREKLVPEFDLQKFVSTYESLKTKVAQLTTNVDIVNQHLTDRRAIGELASGGETARKIGSRLSALQEHAQQVEEIGNRPMLLRAPIDGIVASINRRPGENVLAGDSIMTINGVKGNRLVGYLRQPITVALVPGMKVTVRPRSGPRIDAESDLAGIGSTFEIITNAAFVRPNAQNELGLPLAFSLPPELKDLRPGELVDVRFQAR